MEPTASVLIVDDMADARTMLRLMLSRLGGYRTLEAENGEEALQLAGKYRPDVIVLDYMMPDMNGIEVCQRLRQTPGTTGALILMLTARTDPGTRRTALEAGANQFMHKPVQPRALLDAVQAMLESNNNRGPAVNGS